MKWNCRRVDLFPYCMTGINLLCDLVLIQELAVCALFRPVSSGRILLIA